MRMARLAGAVLLVLLVLIGSVIFFSSRSDSYDGLEPYQNGQPTFVTPSGAPNIVGVNYHGVWEDVDDQARARVLDEFVAAGVEWVRLDIAWGMLQPDGPDSYDMEYGVPRVDKRIQEIHERGLKTLMMFYWAPSWASGTTGKNGVPRDAEEYAAAAAWVVDRYRGQLDAIELWNEPDLDRFLADTSVFTYTNLLRSAYPKIKQSNPDVTVVAGAPTNVGLDWYAEMYARGGGGNYDALGVHPYLIPADMPPESPAQEFGKAIVSIADLISIMAANGEADVPLWATEYGWSTHDNSGYAGAPESWQRGVSEQQQADYLIRANQVMARFPQVEASFWYTDRDLVSGDPQEDNFGLLTADLDRKTSWYGMRCAAAKICGPTD